MQKWSVFIECVTSSLLLTAPDTASTLLLMLATLMASDQAT